MDIEATRNRMRELIGIKEQVGTPSYHVIDITMQNGYERYLIEYEANLDKIYAYLLIPYPLEGGTYPAVLIHHQHNGERHLGKSEVCGIAGDPFQAFGEILAENGFVVLAPDAVLFEDRRPNHPGMRMLNEDSEQYYNDMSYHILQGDHLMKKALEDSMHSISLLSSLGYVEQERIGTLGHGYGGIISLFLAALDPRIHYTAASGCLCTYKSRIRYNMGMEKSIEMPEFYQEYDLDDVVSCIAPKKLLLVSADQDQYSYDAEHIYKKGVQTYLELHKEVQILHKRYTGGHPLTNARFNDIMDWVYENGWDVNSL